MSLSRQNATIWEDSTEGVAAFSSTTSSSNPLSSTTKYLNVNLNETTSSCDEDEDVRTSDEGSPASQTSLGSEDFLDQAVLSALILSTPSCAQFPVPFVMPKGFLEMVARQRQERKSETQSQRMEWVSKRHQELFGVVPGEVRLPSLIAESYRHEIKTIRNNQRHLTEGQVADLLADTKRSYKSIFAEVQRAVKSNPPLDPETSVAQHRQNVAQSGVQCFAAMLPYSNGICGAITDARRAQHSATSGIPQHILLDEGFHTLHGTPAPNTTNTAAVKCPKGTALGRTGRFIPISMSAEHGKGDRVSLFRRQNLVNKNKPASPKPQQQHSYRTPTFARQRMPHNGTQYRRPGCGTINASSVTQGQTCRGGQQPGCDVRHVDPVASH